MEQKGGEGAIETRKKSRKTEREQKRFGQARASRLLAYANQFINSFDLVILAHSHTFTHVRLRSESVCMCYVHTAYIGSVATLSWVTQPAVSVARMAAKHEWASERQTGARDGSPNTRTPAAAKYIPLTNCF